MSCESGAMHVTLMNIPDSGHGPKLTSSQRFSQIYNLKHHDDVNITRLLNVRLESQGTPKVCFKFQFRA